MSRDSQGVEGQQDSGGGGWTVWCHAKGCDNIIRNDEPHTLRDIPAGNRSHVQVNGVPFCMDCYDDRHPAGPHIANVPVREEDVEIVLGGWPTAQDSCVGGDSA